MEKIVAVAVLLALLLSTGVFLVLGIFLAGLLSIILSITDLSRWTHRMRWTVPISGGTQILAAVGVYVLGMRSNEWVFLPFLAVPILFSGLVLLLSPLYGLEESIVSRKTRWAAVLWILLGLILVFPGIILVGGVIKMSIDDTGEQVPVTAGALFVTWGCLVMTFPGGIICIFHGLRSMKRSAKELVCR
jgi:hypothetical protein